MVRYARRFRITALTNNDNTLSIYVAQRDAPQPEYRNIITALSIVTPKNFKSLDDVLNDMESCVEWDKFNGTLFKEFVDSYKTKRKIRIESPYSHVRERHNPNMFTDENYQRDEALEDFLSYVYQPELINQCSPTKSIYMLDISLSDAQLVTSILQAKANAIHRENENHKQIQKLIKECHNTY